MPGGGWEEVVQTISDNLENIFDNPLNNQILKQNFSNIKQNIDVQESTHEIKIII